jgi:glycine/D-amino acid oxidase-like deaminating enzyme
MLPSHTKYLIIGAGMHGLSTSYHLALELKKRALGSGKDILVIDKSGIGAGASGIACGVVRNNYFQPAMRELMAHSVEVWESDPKAYSYHPVGYMQISSEVMHSDVASIYEQQNAIGYPSEFVEGSADSMAYMQGIFDDWQAKGITSVLHEKKGGYSNNMKCLQGMAAKAESEEVTIIGNVEVTGVQFSGSSVSAVETNRGTIQTDYVVVGAGPWVNTFWKMLDLPSKINVRDGDTLHEDVQMWRYYCLQEGTLGVDPKMLTTNEGEMSPVIHVDTDAPLYSDIDGKLITDRMWGIYYKPDFSFDGVQGGAAPYNVDGTDENFSVDPYGTESPDFVVGNNFIDMWCAALAFCQKRFEDTRHLYRNENASGGLGALAPDSFPVFDVYRENCYVIADSNHGYKMLGVGKLVAAEIMGESSTLLEPFRFSRFEEGKLHPVSNSPFPWS